MCLLFSLIEKSSEICEKKNKGDRLKGKKQSEKVSEEKEKEVLEVPEKRKRTVDTKVVKEFIKSQKQKRLEQMKIEKKSKEAEKEARKKNLDELRKRTLQLAAQSKKKKVFFSTFPS